MSTDWEKLEANRERIENECYDDILAYEIKHLDPRVILSCSNVGFSWYEYDEEGYLSRAGFTVFLDYWTGAQADIIVWLRGSNSDWTSYVAELANDAFVAHHAWEVELEAMHRPLILTMEDEGDLRFNPLTILRQE